MKPFEYSTFTETVISEDGTLQDFYRLAGVLSKTRHVHLMSKEDDAMVVEWHYKYRGDALSLQYSVYNGVTLLYNGKDRKNADKIAGRLKNG
ncbi:hypothetical protein [Parafilimonas sp.]|uniref:hypothetical protein n=1 Tax=Parafilimonas sp. TaxID=1969739 RepID=UPI0039E723B4